jgi:nicotinamidase-related amidase/type 1 glutamine amidotransferase
MRPLPVKKSRHTGISAALALLVLFNSTLLLSADTLTFKTRSRVETEPGSESSKTVLQTVQWESSKTAIVVCDMWDRHWCPSATERVAEMAPRMNEVLKAARNRGVFIIHCPSGTLDFYKDHPARQRALQAPKVDTPIPLQGWCNLDPSKEAPLPIDDSDEGCDGCATCSPFGAWSRQIATIEIHDEDAITDSAEAYYLMRERGITNVIVMGVHANMCVLGRPFSIRQMVNQGQNVLLMRDLTDAMYNSYAAPYVNHFRGTELVVEHVEQFWCPTITSDAFLGGQPFRFRANRPPHVVFLIGEDEYQTWETLPDFASRYINWRGIQTTIIHANPNNKHDFPGLKAALQQADLLVISVRRRALSKENLDAIRNHINRGKGIIGIRTASHAFEPRGDDAKAGASWPEFDEEILGCNYHNHHGNEAMTQVHLPTTLQIHPLLTNIDLDALTGNGSLYLTSPLQPSATPVLLGTIPGKPAEPVVWTHAAGPRNAKVFCTSFGHPNDFQNPSFRRLLLNGMLWTLNQPIPPDNRLQPL